MSTRLATRHDTTRPRITEGIGNREWRKGVGEREGRNRKKVSSTGQEFP
jgi:hypothetical protein